MDDLLSEFLTETSESLAVLDVELVKFEQEPGNVEILSNIFRLVHTIKGTSGFLGLPRLEAVAHAGEDVLGKFRDGELEVTPEAVTLVLKTIDAIRDSLAGLEETGSEPEGDDSELIGQLRAMADGEAAPAAEAPAESEAADEAPAEAADASSESAEEAAEIEDASASSGGPVLDENGFPVATDLLAEVAEAESQGIKAATEAELKAEMEAEMAKEKGEEPAPAPAPAAEAKKEAKKDDKKEKDAKGATEAPVTQQTIRVNVDLLENLMTLVSELVLTRNSLNQMVRGHDDSEFVVPLQRLSHITSDLQEGVMKTRMQPIGNAWAKLPRIVRDLAVESGKKIDLQMVGAETELDRQILELIKDPLTHMVRNSADHGLEDPAGRAEANKPETGVIVLQAFHEGGHIVIEISDDGRGINLERVKEKIVNNGLATEAELDGMSDQQIQQFIFQAGFSTAEKITSVSGRGVGMDVVRTNIEKIGGTIELNSRAGLGSTFTIKIPLTLAIVSALIVECGGQRFAIPQLSVLELVRASAHSEYNVEMVNDTPVLRLRNRLLPLVNLRELLKVETWDNGHAEKMNGVAAHEDGADDDHSHDHHSDDNSALDLSAIDENAAELDHVDGESEEESAELERDDGPSDDESFIVVSQVGNYTFGIIVDRVFDTEEIVVKPVAPILREINLFSGNTILGDGSVIMILDPNGIASETGEISVEMDHKDALNAKEVAGHGSDTQSILVFRAGDEELKAVPLALVARLEEIDMAAVEHSDNRYVVQYRGHLMPLIPFAPDHEWKTEGRVPVLVFTDNDRSVGLVVDEIVDIVRDDIDIELRSQDETMLGSAVINGKATSVIDAGYYLTKGFTDWFDNTSPDPEATGARRRRVLLVDDSSFFRNLMTPVLTVAGFDVTAVESAKEALEMRDSGTEFDIIVSDIEMPDMTGFEFAKNVRSGGKWQDTPLVALSARVRESDFEMGRTVGFTEYISKYDRDALLRSLTTTAASLTDTGAELAAQ